MEKVSWDTILSKGFTINQKFKLTQHKCLFFFFQHNIKYDVLGKSWLTFGGSPLTVGCEESFCAAAAACVNVDCNTALALADDEDDRWLLPLTCANEIWLSI
jgi:hypothetical protein